RDWSSDVCSSDLVSVGVIPMRHGVEAVIDHPQGAAQILFSALAPGQIGKIGGNSRVVRRAIILVEASALDTECKILAHFSPKPLMTGKPSLPNDLRSAELERIIGKLQPEEH